MIFFVYICNLKVFLDKQREICFNKLEIINIRYIADILFKLFKYCILKHFLKSKNIKSLIKQLKIYFKLIFLLINNLKSRQNCSFKFNIVFVFRGFLTKFTSSIKFEV